MPTRHRKPARKRYLVLTTCALGVLGAGFAGIASAQTTHHRPAAAHRAPVLGPATRLAAARPGRPHRPRPGANGLTDLMLAEVAPNDGHRRNLLNSGFKHIGLAVTRGGDGRVWVTQDFVN